MHKQVVNILRTIYTILNLPFYFSYVCWQELYRTPGVFVKYNHIAACHTIRLIQYDLTAIQSREYRINCLYNEISGIPLQKTNGHLCRCVRVYACWYTHKPICPLHHSHLQMFQCYVCFILSLQNSEVANYSVFAYTIMGFLGLEHWKCE